MKYVNGKYIELTPEEISTMEFENRKASLMERSRAFSEVEVSRMLITRQINTLTVDDNTALRMREFYPEWEEGNSYTVGYKVRYGDNLWRVCQAHTSQVGWEPSTATASLWEQINETHDGTLDDPISYEGNMALENGKYYHHDYVIYLCIRDTGNPVYHALSDLVGVYVEKV